MDTEFPKITFDIFEFARANNCMIRMWFEDYSFTDPVLKTFVPNYVLRIDIVKHGLRHSVAISTVSAEATNVGIDFVIETELKDAIVQLEKKWSNLWQ